MTPVYDDPARPLTDFLFRSGGTTAAYMLITDAGRVIVNTGLGYEAPHHKRVFDAVCAGPTPYILTTQGHVDHVGGVGLFREPNTVYVAQANNQACQHDDERIAALRMRTAGIWFDLSGRRAKEIAAENPGVPMRQDKPDPDLTFDRRLGLRVGELDLELIATPGGETIDSCVVWLPQHGICLISNLVGPLFPHFPNLNTLRGDRYRFVEPYLAAIRTVRGLEPSMLVTGRHEPIVGRELIDAALCRLHDAVDYVHRETLAGMNAGKDVATLMREVRLPADLRVGEGYGTVAWGVRTIWEAYMGWFHLRSTTELYPLSATEVLADLVDLVGPEVALERARAQLAAGEPVAAIHLVEAVLRHRPADVPALEVGIAAHQALLGSGGDVSFWESGWLRHQMAEWQRERRP
ncbi:MAG: alkyl sulfatase dimerization domain-containing protein [Acidimicrobiales bacterium]